MHDSEVVASIAVGDPRGLAVAYDRYADPLYKYCRTLLRDPADAAVAVQDAFVIAESRLDGLRDSGRLRAWLYAVARNETARILRSKAGAAAVDEAPDVTDDSVDIGHDAQQADLRALFEDAADGLSQGEREAIELQLRQGLDPAEVATVLGVSDNRAHTLLSRAAEQLGTCLAVLLVGRAGRDDCGDLDSMLAGWDGRLTVLLRKRVHRHIEHCATCGARQVAELRPAMLFGLPPATALATGAELSLRLAPGLPEDLRTQTITIATGYGADAAAQRDAVLSRAGAFNHSGFPKPVHGGRAGFATHGGKAGGVTGAVRSWPRGEATVTAAVVVVVAIAAVAFALISKTQPLESAAGPKPSSAPPAAVTSPAAKRTPPTPATRATSAAPTTTASSSSAKPGQTSTSTTAAATPTTASRSATPPSPTPSPTPTPAPTPGTLSESPQGGTAADPEALVLAPDGAGSQIDLTASGSGDWNVDWSVTVANDSGGAVSVAPASSGTLTPTGATATLTVTANQFIPCGSSADPTITVDPGGAVYSVCTSLL
jgi:RNA polymerase sigma factor (sigma-70 family)